VDLLAELDVGYPLVVSYDIFILDTCESVVVLKKVISVLSESFVMHPGFPKPDPARFALVS
jgi:hypothetical protein